MKKIVMVMMVVLGFQFFSANIQATVIDFESLGVGGDDGPTYLGTNIYSEDGYTLTTDGEFGFIRLSQTDSIALFSGGGADTLSIVEDNGEIFDLLSIDYLHVGPEPIEFSGTRSDETIVNYTKILDSENTYSTIIFPDFTGLISVSWQGGSGYNHFDNITIVPEPTTFLFFILGATLLRKRIPKT